MIKTDLSEWFINIASPFLSCCALSYTLIYVYFLFDKWASVSFKPVCKRLNPTTVNAFTEAEKFISTSKGFSSGLDQNFPALILFFPLSRIWTITQNTGETSYNFQIPICTCSGNTTLWVPNVFPHSDDSLQLWWSAVIVNVRQK